MNALRLRLLGEDGHNYTLVGQQGRPSNLWTRKYSSLVIILVALVGIVGIVAVLISGWVTNHHVLDTLSLTYGYRSYNWPSSEQPGANPGPCDTVFHGYECRRNISRYWGQYSPYSSIPSEISDEIFIQCPITFAQILSRHGARDPTLDKTAVYHATIQKIRANVKDFPGKYAFLANYEYTLGADQLTTFGQQELVNSGLKFYERYKTLAQEFVPFVRSSGQERVVESARNWTQGFRTGRRASEKGKHGNMAYPHVDVIIPEGEGMNNTLNHDLCTEFESGPVSTIAGEAQSEWANIFASPIQSRLNADLAGANLSIAETIYMMDLCPFNTVASPMGEISAFCDLFGEKEWHQYNYYETLGKYYGYSHGNPLGPTQGVGFVNELIARMTGSKVHDDTTTNHTLDDNPETFPLARHLYADFSHDNDMMGIFSAFGFYNDTSRLPNTTIVEAPDADGFSASWILPFASRAYFEKMKCPGNNSELVRVLINDRALPLTQCNGDEFGRCTLPAFIDSLSFAEMGGHWDQCFP